MTSHDKTDCGRKGQQRAMKMKMVPLPVGAWPKSRLRAKKVRWYVEM